MATNKENLLSELESEESKGDIELNVNSNEMKNNLDNLSDDGVTQINLNAQNGFINFGFNLDQNHQVIMQKFNGDIF